MPDLPPYLPMDRSSDAVSYLKTNFPHRISLVNDGKRRGYSSEERRVINEWVFDRTGCEDGLIVDIFSYPDSYCAINPSAKWAMMYWEWYFKDPDIAFEFKLRWY